MNTLLFTPKIDTRYGSGKIKSRIGLEANAVAFTDHDDLVLLTREHLNKAPLHCILVDEAQFLKKTQVFQLTEIVDKLDIPVLAYGLRTDFQAEPFEGSLYLLAWAESLTEIKTICHCGRKATHVLRVDDKGKPITMGEQIAIGGNERYVSVCRNHFKLGEI